MGLFVAFGGVLFGYDTGTIGGILAMPYWLKTFSTGHTVDGVPAITSSQSSMIVSILVSENNLLAQSYRLTPPNDRVWCLLGSACGRRIQRSHWPATLGAEPRPASGLPFLIHIHISPEPQGLGCMDMECINTSTTNYIVVRWYLLRRTYSSTHCRLLWQKIWFDGYVNQAYVSIDPVLTLTVTMVVFCLGVILQTIATAIPMFTAGFVTE